MNQIVFAVALAAALTASAAPAREINPGIVRATNQFYIGLGHLDQDYREFNDGSKPGLNETLDSETGRLKAYRLGYVGLNHRYWHTAQFDYARGETQYDGYIGLANGQTMPAKTTTENRMVDIYTRHGIAFAPSAKTAVIPYIEFGVSSWGRDIGKGTPYAVSETFLHYAAGLGVQTYYAPIERIVLRGGIGVGHTLIPMTFVGDSMLRLGAAPYSTANAGVDVQLWKRLYLRTDLNYVRWEYGRSGTEEDPTLGPIVEPRSQTKRTRVVMSLGYHF